MPMPEPSLLLALDGAASAPGLLVQAIPFVAMAAIFYFFLIRPQQQEQKDHASLVAALQRGDRVVTNSGIHGKVHEAKGDTLVIEVHTNTFLTVDRDAVKRKVTAESDGKGDAAKADPGKTDAGKTAKGA
jgi:preprotein translocase subunit YajC